MRNYSDKELREVVGILLNALDTFLPDNIHHYGNTPDWFVAAAIACDIPNTMECLRGIPYNND